MKYVYHGSLSGELKRLTPRVSTHGKKYVYAVAHPEIAISFIPKANDLDFLRQRYKGQFIIIERWPGAFEHYYKNQAGYLYTLSATHFTAGITTRSEELVSEKPVAIVRQRYIQDIYKALKRYEKLGKLKLYIYEQQPAFVKKLQKSDLIEKVKARIKVKKGLKQRLLKLKNTHPDIYDQVI